MESENKYVTNEAEVDLPPLQTSRRAVWDYYRIEFLPSGLPGRRHRGTLYPHPIYAPYVINDYMAQYRRGRDDRYLLAAHRVAQAAIDAMTMIGDGLAFIYDQERTAVSLRTHTFYSGLTQARYIEALRKLVVAPGGEKFTDSLELVVKSLLVPVEDGGVARRTPGGGLVIEEYPSIMPDCTLNGWTTATCIIGDYVRSTGNGVGSHLYQQSVRGLEELIHLYDFPEWANSRYRLTGKAVLRVVPRGGGITLTDCAVEVPGSGTFWATRGGDPAGNALSDGPVELSEGTDLTMIVNISRISWPAPNTVLLAVDAECDGMVEVAIGMGDYHPLRTHVDVKEFRALGEYSATKGRSVIEVRISWADAENSAYPTGFGKVIAGRKFNQYHWIHVDTLQKLARDNDSELLQYYADKWRRYPERWPGIPQYRQGGVTLERFDVSVHR